MMTVIGIIKNVSNIKGVLERIANAKLCFKEQGKGLRTSMLCLK